jgi:hypothetical protein
MIQAPLTLITALALSSIAAYYSVIGLAQIFPGSFWPIIIMGSVLEAAKLVTVSWLYNNWKQTNKLMKSYFIVAVLLLMLITSMGIFGFLARSHMETNVVIGTNSVQLQTLNSQEKILRDRLQYLLKKAGDDPEKISRVTDKAIQDTQAELKKLTNEKLPLLQEENKMAAEIGPIKYIAEIFYDKTDADLLDKAVRLVIFIIIIVFDPLAVLLLIAANKSFKTITPKKEVRRPVVEKKIIEPPKQEEIKVEEPPKEEEEKVIIEKKDIVEIQEIDLQKQKEIERARAYLA